MCSRCGTKDAVVQYQEQSGCPAVPAERRHQPPPIGPPGEEIDTEGICPGSWARQHVAADAHRAHEWMGKGQLQLLYPDGVPRIVIRAIACVDSTLGQWQRERSERQKIKAEQESKRRNQHHG